MAESDGALDYALAAMDRAASVRNSGSGAGASRRGIGGPSAELPGLDFAFRSPSFLSGRSRWVLLGVLAAAGFLALWLAYRMAVEVPSDHGAEWIGPPIMSLVVAAIAFALAYATVMGFGNVELKTTVGGGGTQGPEPPKPGEPAEPPKPPKPGEPGGLPKPPKPSEPAALTITGTVPARGARDVEPDVSVEATFSGALVPVTVSGATFSLRKQDGSVVAATIAVDDDGLTARLQPNVALEPGTMYEAVITTGVRDAGGHALDVPRMWSFTTAS